LGATAAPYGQFFLAPTLTADGGGASAIGLDFEGRANPTSGLGTQAARGVNIDFRSAGSQPLSQLSGYYSFAIHEGTGVANSVIGAKIYGQTQADAGRVVSFIEGIEAGANYRSVGSLAGLYGMYLNDSVETGATVVDHYGFYLEALAGAGTVTGSSTGIYIEDQTFAGVAGASNLAFHYHAPSSKAFKILATGAVSAAGGALTITTGGSLTATTYEGAEMAAPSAPAANGYKIFAQDNGGGKTQLMVIFASGAAQQLAIQP
jgi:hypothetical protein